MQRNLDGSFPDFADFTDGINYVSSGFSGLVFKSYLRGVPVVLKVRHYVMPLMFLKIRFAKMKYVSAVPKFCRLHLDRSLTKKTFMQQRSSACTFPQRLDHNLYIR